MLCSLCANANFVVIWDYNIIEKSLDRESICHSKIGQECEVKHETDLKHSILNEFCEWLNKEIEIIAD